MRHTPARFRELASATLAGKKLDDYVASFSFLGKHALPTVARDVEATTALLGRPPRTYEAFVADCCSAGSRDSSRAKNPAKSQGTHAGA